MADDKKDLRGKKVAILLTDGFEQSEMTEPRKALEAAGAETFLVSPKADKVQGWKHHDRADEFRVDMAVDKADASTFDALVLPGGVMNPDELRVDEKAVGFVRAFVAAKKPIAAICHGLATLTETDVLRGRKVTSWPSLKTDLSNAGATWVDQEVVVDKGLVTSRKPDDLPAFIRKTIEEIKEGPHANAAAAR